MKKAYNVEILSVGTEILLGHTTNTDARDISLMLSELGINVKYHTVVGDNPQRLADCIEIARERADIIISTGGLGPTCDDLTKQILARSFGLELEMHEDEKLCLYDYLTPRIISSRPCSPSAALCSTTIGARLPAARSRHPTAR